MAEIDKSTHDKHTKWRTGRTSEKKQKYVIISIRRDVEAYKINFLEIGSPDNRLLEYVFQRKIIIKLN